MLLTEIILIAIGLSMDSLAVSVTCGAVQQRHSSANLFKMALTMAIAQAGMTALGYAAGLGFEQYIKDFDHWIAFGLLVYLGGRMIYCSQKDHEDECQENPFCAKTLCGLALATSIDALAVGISLALLDTPLLQLSMVIAIVTFIFSAVGVYAGYHFGHKFDFKLDLIGGLILIGIGTKILAEHLFFG